MRIDRIVGTPPSGASASFPRIFGVLASSAVALPLIVAPAPASAAPSHNWHIPNSSHCLDSATDVVGKLQMWSCDSGTDEQWYLQINAAAGAFSIMNERTGDCIYASAYGASSAYTTPCDTSAPYQLWILYYANGTGAMWQQQATGLCLQTASVGNGSVPFTAPCDPNIRYQFWDNYN